MSPVESWLSRSALTCGVLARPLVADNKGGTGPCRSAFIGTPPGTGHSF